MTSTAVLTPTDPVVLRPARSHDDAALRDLAAVDSTRLGPGPHLVAEVAGELRAAVSMSDGRAVADPFHPTAVHVALLRAQVAALSPAHSVRRRRPRRRLGLFRGPRVAAA